ncbi:protein transport protein SEC31, partial [Klebsormidium nitens]
PEYAAPPVYPFKPGPTPRSIYTARVSRGGPSTGPPRRPPRSPAGPPPTVHTADVSKVKAELKPVVAVITKLFDEVAGAMPPSRKKETEDSSKKLGLLFVKLNTGDVSAALTEKLQRVAQAIAAGDIPTAKHVQVEMTTTHWDEGSQWMPVLKRLIHARSTMR